VELKRYLRVISRRRWVAAIAFLVTSLTTFVLVIRQPPVYEASGTVLLHPRLPGTEGDAIDAFDLLIRGVKVAETYATVARSELIRERAEARLDPGIDPSGVTVGAAVLTDTNILSISARGRDPAAAQALSDAVIDATVAYAQGLDDAYVLSPLDEPKLPANPVGPKRGLTIAIGIVFGMVLAVVLALFAEYLGAGTIGDSSVTDPRTGLYNEGYLRKRLREEMSRADRTGRAFSVVAFRVTMRHRVDGEPWRAPATRDLRRIGELLRLTLRDEAVLAHLGDGEFGALLPETGRAAADGLLARWETGVIAVLDGHDEGANAVPHLTRGVCQYRDRRFVGDREALLAVERMSDRETTGEARSAAGSGAAATEEPPNGSGPAANGPASPIEGSTPAPASLDPQQVGFRRPGASKGKSRAANRKR
jgi:capsular polysaccharide biosynthesis protein/GGDEF domain-containing protein